jgi:Flp pilus assembly pilin Flp
MAEYAVVVVLLIIVAIVALTPLGAAIRDALGSLTAAI